MHHYRCNAHRAQGDEITDERLLQIVVDHRSAAVLDHDREIVDAYVERSASLHHER